MAVNIDKIKAEILEFVRNNDVLTLVQRGCITKEKTFNAQEVIVIEILAKNVRKITNSIVGDLIPYIDYLVNYETNTIVFNKEYTGTHTIKYDVGKTDNIFYDFSQEDVVIQDVPRITFDLISADTVDDELGGQNKATHYPLQFSIYAKDSFVVDRIISKLRMLFFNNQKKFFYSQYIKPLSMTPMDNIVDQMGKILVRSQDFDIWVPVENSEIPEEMGEDDMGEKMQKIGELTIDTTIGSETTISTNSIDIDFTRYRMIQIVGAGYIRNKPLAASREVQGKFFISVDNSEVANSRVTRLSERSTDDATVYIQRFRGDVIIQDISDDDTKKILYVKTETGYDLNKEGSSSFISGNSIGTGIKNTSDINAISIQAGIKELTNMTGSKLQVKIIVTGVLV